MKNKMIEHSIILVALMLMLAAIPFIIVGLRIPFPGVFLIIGYASVTIAVAANYFVYFAYYYNHEEKKNRWYLIFCILFSLISLASFLFSIALLIIGIFAGIMA